MIDDLRGVLESISDPADLAVVLICGTAGFLVDAGLNAVGFLEPGYVGMTAATGALGLKKGIEIGFSKIRQGKRERRRAASLIELLEEEGHHALVYRLQRDLELFESGVVDVDSFRANVTEVVEAYRSVLDRSAG